MIQKGAEIWAKQSDLQSVHGESDRLLVACNIKERLTSGQPLSLDDSYVCLTASLSIIAQILNGINHHPVSHRDHQDIVKHSHITVPGRRRSKLQNNLSRQIMEDDVPG